MEWPMILQVAGEAELRVIRSQDEWQIDPALYARRYKEADRLIDSEGVEYRLALAWSPERDRGDGAALHFRRIRRRRGNPRERRRSAAGVARRAPAGDRGGLQRSGRPFSICRSSRPRTSRTEETKRSKRRARSPASSWPIPRGRSSRYGARRVDSSHAIPADRLRGHDRGDPGTTKTELAAGRRNTAAPRVRLRAS